MQDIWILFSTLGVDVADEAAPPVSCGSRIARELGLSIKGLVLAAESSDRPEILSVAELSEAVGLRVGRHASCEEVADLVVQVLSERRPSLVLMPSNSWWDDLACRVAAGLDIAATVGCVAWRLDEAGSVVFSRPVYDGQVLAEEMAGEEPRIVSVKTAKEDADPATGETAFRVEWLSVRARAERPRIRLVERSRIESLLLDVEEADVIVAGGRGVGGDDGFRLLEELARVLGGTVAGSRIAVDNRWVARERQIGQTGKTVRPKLYFACGISGSSHHLLGMKDSGTIVAVNTDTEAPILRIADAAIVGDYKEQVSAVIDEVLRRTRGVEAS